MARLRTFIGVAIDKSQRDRAVALQETLAQATPEVKWVEPANLHVTLLFLGEVEDRAVGDICRVVAEQTQRHVAFLLTLERIGSFPHARRPRILWIGVGAGTQELCALHDDLEPPLLSLGCYRREERQYSPHITLGRVRSERPADKLVVALAKHAGWRGGETTINEVLIMSSELTPQGPNYTVLSRAKLGRATPSD